MKSAGKRMMSLVQVLLTVSALAIAPKHEFRAAWVTTAWGLDFPLVLYTSGQQSEIRNLLDNLENAGFNAVIFQVRPGCDALYDSDIEHIEKMIKFLF